MTLEDMNECFKTVIEDQNGFILDCLFHTNGQSIKELTEKGLEEDARTMIEMYHLDTSSIPDYEELIKEK